MWENDISFRSMRSYFSEEELESMEIHDPLFASLLNPDGIIQIAGNVLKIDMVSKSVMVIPESENPGEKDFSVKGAMQLSIDDNVLDILQGKIDDGQGKGTYCNSEYVGWFTWDCPAGNIKYRSRYFKAGIYYSLVSRVESTGPGVVASMSTTASVCWWKNKKGTYSYTGYTDETTSNHNFRPYSSTRRLKDYYFRTYFLFRDLGHPEFGYYDPVITLECTR